MLVYLHYVDVLYHHADADWGDIGRGDGLGALVGRQIGGGDVVAVDDGRLVTCEPAGEGVFQHICCHAIGHHQRVGDDRYVIL